MTTMNTSMGAAAAASAAERSQRSVFVGNIPYEATEEELKELFSQAGPVVGFRLVFDRETGKPKGYGFCEYLDQETALSALRNLNQFEFHGRNLRVDTAAGDRSKEELRQLQMTFGGPTEESPYGSVCEPAKAPEAISRAVASLPPEQMFELMKQMKLCIQNNPNEARNMLLQNPQLAYALLQAQVVMRIVDPQVAMSMLHRETNPVQTPIMMPTAPPVVGMPPPSMQPPSNVFSTLPNVTGIPPHSGGMMNMPVMSTAPVSRGDMDYRLLPGGGINSISSSMSSPFGANPSVQSSFPGGGGGGGGGTMSASYGGGMGPSASGPNPFMMPPPGPMVSQGPPNMPGLGLLRGTGPSGGAADDQERAALIMQVLQLTDDQIALLPADQKQSVLILREQLRNAQK